MSVDLAIIGAGPAGMAAAVEAADLGLSVAVIDENPAPGGQVFRGVEAASADRALGADYAAGLPLVRAFRAARIDYRPGTTLWHLEPEAGLLSLLAGGRTAELAAGRILLATGAQERPVPIPGWTLPGVMTAGAAQILLKTVGAVPRGRTVLAGQGPLLWLLAAQLQRAGAPPALILETTPKGRLGAALRAGGLVAGLPLLAKGLALLAETRRIPRRPAVAGLRAEGEGRVARVTWEGGATGCDTLLLHEGVVPATHIPLALGLDHAWDAAQRCWRPRVDAFGAASHPRVAVAGDGAGIGGWQAAVAAGRLAACDAARRLGRLTEEGFARRTAPLLAARRAALALRPFLDALHAPPGWVLAPPEDATLVCRCEEVTAGQVRAAARLGATGPNQVKAYCRAGMGPCQGRICGATVAALIAEARGTTPEAVGTLRPRAPYKPLTVAELAGG
ncbi:(2Fe-2S)-binding protein [Paracraurococcus lichenis]|uniref:(2Fe-2S)-binding protein n=1 Tax=Paracraurococcus lichenis TaxID=3064888 RepID=A0ABT9DSR3_9PROT|nr:(2Fe-2S)-binding protein [Paracraurococcus sp. LOR1-02]MDO9706940.1 (2Fe-2S)-binding protein [Paracraurococcus sp. LOR1-02]